jgi:hypothetical protein
MRIFFLQFYTLHQSPYVISPLLHCCSTKLGLEPHLVPAYPCCHSPGLAPALALKPYFRWTRSSSSFQRSGTLLVGLQPLIALRGGRRAGKDGEPVTRVGLTVKLRVRTGGDSLARKSAGLQRAAPSSPPFHLRAWASMGPFRLETRRWR